MPLALDIKINKTDEFQAAFQREEVDTETITPTANVEDKEIDQVQVSFQSKRLDTEAEAISSVTKKTKIYVAVDSLQVEVTEPRADETNSRSQVEIPALIPSDESELVAIHNSISTTATFC